MKLYLSLAFILALSPFLGYSQTPFPIDSATRKITYTEVVEQQGSKEILYNKALDWFATNFNSANNAIQIRDKGDGKIVCNWSIPIKNGSVPVSANIIVLVKDNKYKYVITDLLYTGNSTHLPWRFEEDPNPWKVNLLKKNIIYIKTYVDEQIKETVRDFKKHMATVSQIDQF